MGLDRTGSQPPRPPLPSPRTASTQQEPPHRCPQLGLPHRRPREHRPHQGTPSSHPLSNSPHHPQPDMRGIDHADPLQHHPHHAHLPRHPTQDTTTATRTTHQHTHGRDRHGPHHRPIQAPKTCATRTPPPGATGADLSALQPTPKPAHTPTADKPSAARTRTHSHTAATITTNHHTASHHDTPKPATTTKTTKHQHNTSSTTAARPAHNALTSGNTKHHAGEITGDTKTFPSNPRGYPPWHASRPLSRHRPEDRARVTDLN